MKANSKILAKMRATKKVLVDFSLINDSVMSVWDDRIWGFISFRHTGIWFKNAFGVWDDVVIIPDR
ncbi:TPA: hypothetical protein ACGO2G_000608 [Streptococcus suis]